MLLISPSSLCYPDFPSHPFGDVVFLSSIDSPASLAFRLSATSQLYTRAKATSNVCKQVSYEQHNISSPSTYRDLLSQKFQVLFAVRQARFRRGKLRLQKVLCLWYGVCQHDVCLTLRQCNVLQMWVYQARTPSHRNTSSVGGISAFAYSVSLSSNVVSMGSASGCLCFSKHSQPKSEGHILPSSSLRIAPCPASSVYQESCL